MRPAPSSQFPVPSSQLPSLSVIVPAFNEEGTVGEVLRSLVALGSVCSEVLVVDDGSTDRTFDRAAEVARRDCRIRLLRHEVNRGKGAAVRTALPFVTSDVVVIQDADLEYDPEDLPRLLRHIHDHGVTAVYGSRWLGAGAARRPWSSRVAARLLSWLTNRLFGSCITDESTCYKMVRTAALRSLELESEGFDFCAETTAKLLLRGHPIHELPISYAPRGVAQGKKIRWRDGLTAVAVLVRLRFGGAARRGNSAERNPRGEQSTVRTIGGRRW